MTKFKTPVIAIPHQMPAEIWFDRPEGDPASDGHDLHAVLESREEAEAWVKRGGHQSSRVAALIDRAFGE